MNYTRQCWSKTLKCTKIHTDLVSVLSLTIFFCFLPFVFYTSVKMQGDSKNRNTGKVIFWKLLDNNKQNKANEHQQSGRKPGGGGTPANFG